MNNLFPSLILSLLLLLLLLLLVPFSTADHIAPAPVAPTADDIPYGTIYRTTKQQILATIPPGVTSPSLIPFLTSPSGKYTAALARNPTAPTAGGFGNDFCFIQVTETETKQSLWESECSPISTANACTLVFDDAGFELFDGSESVYDTEADGDHVNELELVDEGDMRIIDKRGELAWKASEQPRSEQRCGEPGSVGLAPESPAFSGVIGSGAEGGGPFGQPAAGQAAAGVGGGAGEELAGDGEPLVDGTVYDSGSVRGPEMSWFGVASVCLGLFVM